MQTIGYVRAEVMQILKTISVFAVLCIPNEYILSVCYKVLRDDGILLTWFTHSSFDQFVNYEKEVNKTFQADFMENSK